MKHLIKNRIAPFACVIGVSWLILIDPAGFQTANTVFANQTSKQSADLDDKCFSSGLPRPKTFIDLGVLNKYAKKLPRPKYHAEAKANGICGEVDVEVVVDVVSGEIYWARIKNGHPLLQEAVKKVVCKARFSPTSSDGPPARLGGILKYRFSCR